MKLEDVKKDPKILDRFIIQLIFKDANFRDSVLPYINKNVFMKTEAQKIYEYLTAFISTFNVVPTAGDFRLALTDDKLISYFNDCFKLDVDKDFTSDHLLKILEEHIKKTLLQHETVSFMDGLYNDVSFDVNSKASIVDKFNDIFAFSFDTNVGLNLWSDSGFESMWEFLQSTEECIPTNIPYFDNMIGGGFHKKTLTTFMAGTGKGKSLVMTSLAAQNVWEGKKALYITLEMSEHRIAERVFANSLNIDISQLKSVSKPVLKELHSNFTNKCKDLLVIKEFPPRSISTNNINRLLKELKDKQKFVPDIIYIDYLTLMKPAGAPKNTDDYTGHKIVSENLRALAIINDVPVVSAIQTNRGGADSAYVSLKDISESFGIAMTADLMIAITQTAEQKILKQATWSLPKNRFGITNLYTTVIMNYAYMRIEPDPNATVMMLGEIETTANFNPATGDSISINSETLQPQQEDVNDAIAFLKNRSFDDSAIRTANLTGLDFK